MQKKFNIINKNQFTKNNIIFFCGSAAVAFLNYLYHPVLSRLMAVEDFGEVQALISIYLQLGIILTVFGYIVVNIVSNDGRDDKKTEFVLKLEEIAYFLTFAVSFVIIIFSNNLKNYLNFHSFYPFIALALLLITTVPLTFRTSYLQAKHLFWSLSLTGMLFSGGKLLFAVLLVWFGLKSFGAIAGLVIANGVALFYVIKKTKISILGSLSVFKKVFRTAISDQMKKELKYGIFIFIILISMTLLYTADVVIVRLYLPSTEAGLYSGVAVIARIIFFATASVSGVLLPSVKLSKSKENNKLLKMALFAVFLIGGTLLIIFSFFPEIIINLLISSKYEAYSGILPRASLFLFLSSIANILFTYCIALRKYFAAYIAGFGVFIVFVLSLLNHASAFAIVNNFIITNFSILSGLVIWLSYERLQLKHE